jgi:hypothetical protein
VPRPARAALPCALPDSVGAVTVPGARPARGAPSSRRVRGQGIAGLQADVRARPGRTPRARSSEVGRAARRLGGSARRSRAGAGRTRPGGPPGRFITARTRQSDGLLDFAISLQRVADGGFRRDHHRRLGCAIRLRYRIHARVLFSLTSPNSRAASSGGSLASSAARDSISFSWSRANFAARSATVG